MNNILTNTLLALLWGTPLTLFLIIAVYSIAPNLIAMLGG